MPTLAVWCRVVRSRGLTLEAPRAGDNLVTFSHMLTEEMPTLCGDGFNADAFAEVYCTKKLARSVNIVSATTASVESM